MSGQDSRLSLIEHAECFACHGTGQFEACADEDRPALTCAECDGEGQYAVVRASAYEGAVPLAEVCEFLRSATYPDPATGGDRHPHGYKAAAADLERRFGGQ